MTKAHKGLSTVYRYTKLSKYGLLSLGQRLTSLIVAPPQDAFFLLCRGLDPPHHSATAALTLSFSQQPHFLLPEAFCGRFVFIFCFNTAYTSHHSGNSYCLLPPQNVLCSSLGFSFLARFLDEMYPYLGYMLHAHKSGSLLHNVSILIYRGPCSILGPQAKPVTTASSSVLNDQSGR